MYLVEQWHNYVGVALLTYIKLSHCSTKCEYRGPHFVIKMCHIAIALSCLCIYVNHCSYIIIFTEGGNTNLIHTGCSDTDYT